MPIYEYVCEKCGAHTEAMQKVSDPQLKRCKKCRGKLRKMISRTSFQLKGSGWYKTDYSAKPEKTQKKKADGASETTPESPPSNPPRKDSTEASSAD